MRESTRTLAQSCGPAKLPFAGTDDIPGNCIAAGNPARVVRYFNSTPT